MVPGLVSLLILLITTTAFTLVVLHLMTLEVPATLRQYLLSPQFRFILALAVLGGALSAGAAVFSEEGPLWDEALCVFLVILSMSTLFFLTLSSSPGARHSFRWSLILPPERFRMLPAVAINARRVSFRHVPRIHLPFLLDRERLARLLNARIPDDWPPEFIDEGVIAYLEQVLPESDGASCWWMYLLVTRDEPTLIGTCGFKGPPVDGAVELGYSLVPSAHGRGYATEAVRALAAFALRQPGVKVVRAETLASRPASIRVLERCGFHRTGTRPDPELHEAVITFECRRVSPDGAAAGADAT